MTVNRLKIEQNIALSAAMQDIMQINGSIVNEGRWGKEAYKKSVQFLQGVKEDISNALDKKIEEMKKIAERTV